MKNKYFKIWIKKNLNPQRLYRHFYPSLPTQPHHKKAHGTTSVSERGGISAEWFFKNVFYNLPYFQPFGLINELSDDLWFLVVRSWDLSIPAPSSLPPAMDWTGHQDGDLPWSPPWNLRCSPTLGTQQIQHGSDWKSFATPIQSPPLSNRLVCPHTCHSLRRT